MEIREHEELEPTETPNHRALTRRSFLRWSAFLPVPLLLAACEATAPTPTTGAAAKPAGAAPATAATPAPAVPAATATTGTTSAAAGAVVGSPTSAAAATAARPAVASPTGPPQPNAQTSLPTCIVRPQQTEGPYFVDSRLIRSDIRVDPADGTVSAGVPLELTFRVLRVGGAGCTPLAGATVDLWQCDAHGEYSAVRDPGSRSNAATKQFLRGAQVTDADGVVRFTTIYPGWYPGRAVHIHFKIRTDPSSRSGRELTSQLYFDDALTDQVHAVPPYASRGRRNTRNDRDGSFRQGGGQLQLQLTKVGDGYASTFDVGLQMA